MGMVSPRMCKILLAAANRRQLERDLAAHGAKKGCAFGRRASLAAPLKLLASRASTPLQKAVAASFCACGVWSRKRLAAMGYQ
eukprot:9387993-Lingulodinium_polyedra.AAC.1